MLARSIGVDAAGLVETVRRYNADVRTGVDREFGKGDNRYDVPNGDAYHTPNPCLALIEHGPFCAVAVYPTPLETSLGRAHDERAQACDHQGATVPGLFAGGNDMDSPFGGEYPGAGAQIGLAMAFGYVAARRAASIAGAIAAQGEGQLAGLEAKRH